MKKNKLIVLQLVIAFTLICTSVYAAVNTTIEISTSTTEIKQGSEFEVTLSLDKVDSNQGVTSVEGYINYNKDIFEELTVNSIVPTSENFVEIGDNRLPIEDATNAGTNLSDYGITFNGNPSSENDVKILIDFSKAIKSNTELIKVKFKVKDNAKTGTETKAISYDGFEITAGNETGSGISKSINVTIVEKTNVEPPAPDKEVTAVKISPSNNVTVKTGKTQKFEATVEGTVDDKSVTWSIEGNKNQNTKISDAGVLTVAESETSEKIKVTATAKADTSKKSTVTVNVEKDNSKDNNKNTNTNTNKNTNTNTNKNTNTNTNKNTNTNNTNKNDATVAGTRIPETGAKVFVLPAIVLIVIAYISYNKYMKYKDI